MTDTDAAQRLREYADLLEANGFTIYLPTGPGHNWTYFVYSQVVDGQECFGTVQAEYFGGYTHLMPIRPSAQFGSSMVVDGVPNPQNQIGRAELTVEEARTVARPSNTGPYVSGRHYNHKNPGVLARHFVRREPKGAAS